MPTLELNPTMQKFILHWGEMGTRWGINRTVAQIHALLYLSPRPLNAEEIAATLKIARSNVSTSLRELQTWSIVHIVHQLGDRRDYFECMKDVWEMFRIIVDERKKRETDPTIDILNDCIASAAKEGQSDDYTKERLAELLEFFKTMTEAYEKTRDLPTKSLVNFVKTGNRVQKVLSMIKSVRRKKAASGSDEGAE